MNTQERVFNNSEEVASSDIRKELFEGDNIRASQSEERKTAREMIEQQNVSDDVQGAGEGGSETKED